MQTFRLQSYWIEKRTNRWEWMMQYDTQINNRIKNIQKLFQINWSNKI